MILIHKKLVTTTIATIFIGCAILLLHRQVRNISFAELRQSMDAISGFHLIISLVLTFTSFLCLALYELIAVKVGVEQKVRHSIPLFTGASANAIANTLGFHAVTGGAWRYRVYSAIGLSLGDIARIISVASAGIGLSFISVTALALVADEQNPISFGLVGVGLLLILGAVLYWTSLSPRRISVGKWLLIFPDFRNSLKLILIGIIEMLCAIGALYVLLPQETLPSFAHFTLFYIGAILLGIVSSAPGGIGVFEATMMAAFGTQHRAAIFAALLLYRIVYNLLPFLIACIGIALFELRKRDQFEGG